MIWFASITINLGPTFLSGALAASAGSYSSYGPGPSCPLVRGPFRHYVLNALWIGVNAVCVGLTLFHLKKLHRDLTKVGVSCNRCLRTVRAEQMAWRGFIYSKALFCYCVNLQYHTFISMPRYKLLHVNLCNIISHTAS